MWCDCSPTVKCGPSFASDQHRLTCDWCDRTPSSNSIGQRSEWSDGDVSLWWGQSRHGRHVCWALRSCSSNKRRLVVNQLVQNKATTVERSLHITNSLDAAFATSETNNTDTSIRIKIVVRTFKAFKRQDNTWADLMPTDKQTLDA